MGFQDDFAQNVQDRRRGGDAGVSGGACQSDPRHPGESRDLPEDSAGPEEIPAFAGMTVEGKDDEIDGVTHDEVDGVAHDEIDGMADEGRDGEIDGVPDGGGQTIAVRPQAVEGRLSSDGRGSTGSPLTDREKTDIVDIPSPTPRHDGWTPQVRVKFLEALSNCGNIRSAVTLVQRSRTSAYNLKRRDIDFSRAWDVAVLLSRDDATDVLQDRAINGIEEDIYHQGEVVGTRQRYDSRLLLAHIARLDKLAERISVSRGAARFGEMLDAIAAEEDTTRLITEPTTDEIAGIVAEAEAEATVREVEATCLRQNNETAAAELSSEDTADAELWAAADVRYGPMNAIDWGDGGPVEYGRMTQADAAALMANHPHVKIRPVAQDDPGFVAAIVIPNAAAMAAGTAASDGA